MTHTKQSLLRPRVHGVYRKFELGNGSRCGPLCVAIYWMRHSYSAKIYMHIYLHMCSDSPSEEGEEGENPTPDGWAARPKSNTMHQEHKMISSWYHCAPWLENSRDVSFPLETAQLPATPQIPCMNFKLDSVQTEWFDKTRQDSSGANRVRQCWASCCWYNRSNCACGEKQTEAQKKVHEDKVPPRAWSSRSWDKRLRLRYLKKRRASCFPSIGSSTATSSALLSCDEWSLEWKCAHTCAHLRTRVLYKSKR